LERTRQRRASLESSVPRLVDSSTAPSGHALRTWRRRSEWRSPSPSRGRFERKTPPLCEPRSPKRSAPNRRVSQRNSPPSPSGPRGWTATARHPTAPSAARLPPGMNRRRRRTRPGPMRNRSRRRGNASRRRRNGRRRREYRRRRRGNRSRGPRLRSPREANRRRRRRFARRRPPIERLTPRAGRRPGGRPASPPSSTSARGRSSGFRGREPRRHRARAPTRPLQSRAWRR
jgi:hypothetical protein